jgi:hypothetical protein
MQPGRMGMTAEPDRVDFCAAEFAGDGGSVMNDVKPEPTAVRLNWRKIPYPRLTPAEQELFREAMAETLRRYGHAPGQEPIDQAAAGSKPKAKP